MFPDQPLSESEIDELDSFLASEAAPEDCMDISMLHGFLTALAVGPGLVLPSEWLPVVWGEGEGPEFTSVERANQILNLVMRLYNEVNYTLHETSEEFQPLLLEGETAEGKVVQIAEGWCEGFMVGVGLRIKEWEPLIRDEEGAILLTPILPFVDPEASTEFLDPKSKSKPARDDIIDMIPIAVASLYLYWLDCRVGRGIPNPSRSVRAPKIKRNDPCP